jgi:hypothetical protein
LLIECLRSGLLVFAPEQIGTSEAQQILRKLADGAAEAWQTREAKVSLQRLARRPGGAP